MEDLQFKLERHRASLIQIVVVAVLLGVGVGILGNILAGYLPFRWGLLLSAALVGLSFAAILVGKLKSLRRTGHVSACLLLDQSNMPIEIPGYPFAEDASRYLHAAFSENPALKQSWTDGLKGVFEPTNENGPTLNLRFRKTEFVLSVLELMEFLCLEELSSLLSEYFNSSETDENYLKEYEREDIPGILLRNRFLELFSTPMERRSSFTVRSSERNERFKTYYASGNNGAIYNRFNLVLPVDSRVEALEPSGFILTSPMLRVTVQPEFMAFSYAIPRDFISLYLGLNQFKRGVADGSNESAKGYAVGLTVRIEISLRAVLAGKRWVYFKWSESLLERLITHFDGDAFFRRIQWDSLRPVLSKLPSASTVQ